MTTSSGFRDALGAERVLVTYHEDLATDPPQVMRAICRFAQLDETLYDGYRFTVRNRTMDLRNRACTGGIPACDITSPSTRTIARSFTGRCVRYAARWICGISV